MVEDKSVVPAAPFKRKMLIGKSSDKLLIEEVEEDAEESRYLPSNIP